MLRRATIGCLMMVSALAIIDRASLLFAPCSTYSSNQNDDRRTYQNECAFREGIVVAGIERLRQTTPEAWTALATILIAAFTWTLYQSSEKMWRVTRLSTVAARRAARAANRQAKIAEDALVNLERPYIFVFDVSAIRTEQILADDDPVEIELFFVEYSVANYGKTPAIIDEACIAFVFDDRGDPTFPPALADDHQLMRSPILQSGEKRTGIREYIDRSMLTDNVIVEMDGGYLLPEFEKEHTYFFRVVVRYHGPFSKGHESGALWLVDYPRVGLLAQRGGEQYNYTK